MGKYEVTIPEVHYATWTIIADSEEEAIELVLLGEGDAMELSYSHTDTDSNNYGVKKLERTNNENKRQTRSNHNLGALPH